MLRREVSGDTRIDREVKDTRTGRDWRGFNLLFRFFDLQIGHIIINADN